MSTHCPQESQTVERTTASSSSDPLQLLEQAEAGLQSLTEATSTCAPQTSVATSHEWRVVAVVLVILGLTEGAFQLGKQRLSKDIEHLAAIPSLASQFAASPSGHPKILFLGNSLTRYGVEEDEFSAAFAAVAGTEPSVLKVVPDNSAIADWFYVFRNQFAVTGRAPDVLVLGFEGGHLRDAPSRHPDRLAQYHCSWSDWPDLCRYDLPDFESRASFVLAKQSSVMGNRERITRRAFDILIPGFRGGMDRVNASLHLSDQPQLQPTYSRLRQLIAEAHGQHVRVVLAAMPVPEAYDFDPQLLEVVKDLRVQLLDLRHIRGLRPEMFFDGLHMDAAAAKIYTHELAIQLASTDSVDQDRLVSSGGKLPEER